MSVLSLAAVLAATCMVSSVPIANDDYPGDFGTPTTKQLEQSVQTWDPRESVQTWSIAHSITPFVVKKEDAADTVLTLASDILFEFGKAEISPTASTAITHELDTIPKSVAVSIGGYTDSVGDSDSNQALSEQRAEAVATVVGAARPDLVLTVQGLGEDNPVADNERGGTDYPEGRQQNRRVEVRYAR